MRQLGPSTFLLSYKPPTPHPIQLSVGGEKRHALGDLSLLSEMLFKGQGRLFIHRRYRWGECDSSLELFVLLPVS